MQSNFIRSSRKQFQYYQKLGDESFQQLSEDDIHWSLNNESNNIAIIVKHIAGNQLSRWSHFLTEDGEKKWRERDLEFVDSYSSKKEMITAWNNGWNCLYSAIDALDEIDLMTPVIIRNEKHTIIEAIQRQIAHYAYHVGQIVYLSKMIQDQHWQPLSIPRNQSIQYNKSKFSQEKS